MRDIDGKMQRGDLCPSFDNPLIEQKRWQTEITENIFLELCAVIPFLVIELLQFVAHGTTIKLLCHVQNFVVMT